MSAVLTQEEPKMDSTEKIIELSSRLSVMESEHVNIKTIFKEFTSKVDENTRIINEIKTATTMIKYVAYAIGFFIMYPHAYVLVQKIFQQ